MTRKKVTLAYISNDSERRASFKKRKKGLIKKVSELSTLCGVDACCIIYSQFEAEPEVWPSVLGAQKVLARFGKMSTIDQTRKMVNQESFTRQRIKKVEDQLRRVRKENKRKEMERFMYTSLQGCGAHLGHFNLADAADLGFVISQALREVKARMEEIKMGEKSAYVQMELALGFPGVQEQAPVMGGEEQEGFPWNLVQSPPFADLDNGFGWDDVFDHNNNGASTSGIKPYGNGGFNF